jgi:hypothetical protein
MGNADPGCNGPRMGIPRRFARSGLLGRRAVVLLICVFPALAAPTPAHAGAIGEWTAPLAPPIVVVRDFHPPAMRWLAGHRGVDLAASTGATVLAAGQGVVIYAGLVAGRGVVVIDHSDIRPGLRTTYEPVTASVATGRQVVAGEPVGVVAATPGHCSPAICLHWGLLRGASYLDPRRLLDQAPVRLLPLGAAALPVPHPAVSGSRMRLFVGLTQSFDRHVGVDLSGRQ